MKFIGLFVRMYYVEGKYKFNRVSVPAYPIKRREYREIKNVFRFVEFFYRV